MSGLVLALPSKGRLKEQVEAWLADCGLPLAAGGRAYRAELRGLPGVEVRLMPAGEIAQALAAGEVHVGVTGEDLLREQGDELDRHVVLLIAPGFGRADLVVAAPRSWIDVANLADLEAVAHERLARTGRRLRVATKYTVQTRRFFAEHGLIDYRIVESAGATEGAPAAGLAEIVVDITTTGATLAANHLRPLDDGLILRSQAQLAASLRATWTEEAFRSAARLLGMVESRARAAETVTLVWPAEQDAQARQAVAAFGEEGAWRTSGLLVRSADLVEVSAVLAAAEVGPVTVTRPEYVFAAASPAAEALARRLGDPG